MAGDSTSCPHCHREPETIWHFLECPHPECAARFQQLHAAVTQLHGKHKVDPHMCQLYWQGLQSIQLDSPIEEQIKAYPPQFQALFMAQRAIGWDQLYYGRISVQWAHQITIDSNYTTNGDLFYATVTSLVWQYILDCWTLRNNALHNPQAAPPDAQVLADQVREIFAAADNNPELAHLLPPQPMETILQKPIRLLQHWVKRGKTQWNNCLTAAHNSGTTAK